jgi:hypothetical protein
MTAAREDYEENEFYEKFQDQTFEAEDQQLLNDQGKCPLSYYAQIKDIDYFIAMHVLNVNPMICFSLVIVISCPCNRVGNGAVVSGSFAMLIKLEK